MLLNEIALLDTLKNAPKEITYTITEEKTRKHEIIEKKTNTKEINTIAELSIDAAFLFNEFNTMYDVNIVLYLDDFYQIPIERHPHIIQYLHDIFKYCYNSSFCFKLSVVHLLWHEEYLPRRLLAPQFRIYQSSSSPRHL